MTLSCIVLVSSPGSSQMLRKGIQSTTEYFWLFTQPSSTSNESWKAGPLPYTQITSHSHSHRRYDLTSIYLDRQGIWISVPNSTLLSSNKPGEEHIVADALSRVESISIAASHNL